MSDLIDRQKAIEALQEEIDKGKPPFNDTIGAVRCGVRLARNIIEDLPSAQPIAKDINVLGTDTISRQAAIDAIDEYIEKNRRPDFIGNMVWVSGVADAMRIVSDLPSVQERKGRWNRISPAKIYECSVCGRQVMTDDIDVYAFCHWCGAKMEGAEE